MKKLLFYLFLVFLTYSAGLYAQENTGEGDSTEVYLIDSYITPEVPHRFILTFFTNDSCKSKVIMDGKYEFIVSGNFAEEHKTEIDVTGLKFDTTDVPFVIYVENKNGTSNRSEQYEVALPTANGQLEVKGGSSNLFMMCCFGGTIFGLPAPGYVSWGGKSFFSLTKEIPIISFQTSNYKLPVAYVSLEYSYIFNAPVRNFVRAGYKHIIQIPYLEYISPGINGFSNLNGFNGVSPEVSIGLFKIYDVFTVYTKYRYNFKPGESGSDFHEITIGVYSGFFTFHVNL
ncbi:MAG: hypothetical protein ACM3S2_05790 [Ignavibacteriales bacterium]